METKAMTQLDNTASGSEINEHALVNWRDLTVLDSDGRNVTGHTLREALVEFAATGSMCGFFFEPLDGQSTDPEDAWMAGPASPSDVDWGDLLNVNLLVYLHCEWDFDPGFEDAETRSAKDQSSINFIGEEWTKNLQSRLPGGVTAQVTVVPVPARILEGFDYTGPWQSLVDEFYAEEMSDVN